MAGSDDIVATLNRMQLESEMADARAEELRFAYLTRNVETSIAASYDRARQRSEQLYELVEPGYVGSNIDGGEPADDSSEQP